VETGNAKPVEDRVRSEEQDQARKQAHNDLKGVLPSERVIPARERLRRRFATMSLLEHTRSPDSDLRLAAWPEEAVEADVDVPSSFFSSLLEYRQDGSSRGRKNAPILRSWGRFE